MNEQKVRLTQQLLKYAYGIVVLVIGLDKLFGTNLIVDWEVYVAPFVENLLPFSVSVFLIIMAVIEIAVGVLFLTKWTRYAAYLSVAWLLLISVDLLMLGHVDIAARDIMLAIGALALAWLTEATSEASAARPAAA